MIYSDRFETSFLTILGFEKVVFSSFWKWFWSYIVSVKASFFYLQALLLVVFSALKIGKWFWYDIFGLKLKFVRVTFDLLEDQIISFPGFLKDFLVCLRSARTLRFWITQNRIFFLILVRHAKSSRKLPIGFFIIFKFKQNWQDYIQKYTKFTICRPWWCRTTLTRDSALPLFHGWATNPKRYESSRDTLPVFNIYTS